VVGHDEEAAAVGLDDVGLVYAWLRDVGTRVMGGRRHKAGCRSWRRPCGTGLGLPCTVICWCDRRSPVLPGSDPGRSLQVFHRRIAGVIGDEAEGTSAWVWSTVLDSGPRRAACEGQREGAQRQPDDAVTVPSHATTQRLCVLAVTGPNASTSNRAFEMDKHLRPVVERRPVVRCHVRWGSGVPRAASVGGATLLNSAMITAVSSPLVDTAPPSPRS